MGFSRLRSSPGPKTGCSGESVRVLPADRAVAILTRSEDRVQQGPGGELADRLEVAILTRSEDRVQPAARSPRCARPNVAILTRSEDRVQPPGQRPTGWSCPGCDPHPVRRPGAARLTVQLRALSLSVAILTRSEDRVQLRETGLELTADGGVAILTRSEDRVQP